MFKIGDRVVVVKNDTIPKVDISRSYTITDTFNYNVPTQIILLSNKYVVNSYRIRFDNNYYRRKKLEKIVNNIYTKQV